MVPPRVLVNAVSGEVLEVAVVAPPPSQLISRRPVANGPAIVSIVRIAQGSAKRIDGALNRGRISRTTGGERDECSLRSSGQQQADSES